MSYQNKLVRFIENHDEARAAAIFAPEKERALAVTTLTLPGARLLHDGQLEGRKIRVPVFLGRRPHEAVDQPLHEFYATLLAAVDQPLFHDGEWQLCECSGWPDNPSFQNLVAWTWQHNEDRCLIAVNLSDSALQALIRIPWTAGATWDLTDVLSNVTYRRDGDDMASHGLYVELAPWNFHFFRWSKPANELHDTVIAATS
jgi:hypothetical protein